MSTPEMPDPTGFASQAEYEAKVAADKAAADAQLATSLGMTREDLEELRQLRHERAQREAREAKDRAEQEARLTPPSHYVHLADGSVFEGSHLGTHHSFGDGTGHPRGDRMVPVAAVYPKGA